MKVADATDHAAEMPSTNTTDDSKHAATLPASPPATHDNEALTASPGPNAKHPSDNDWLPTPPGPGPTYRDGYEVAVPSPSNCSPTVLEETPASTKDVNEQNDLATTPMKIDGQDPDKSAEADPPSTPKRGKRSKDKKHKSQAAAAQKKPAKRAHAPSKTLSASAGSKHPLNAKCKAQAKKKASKKAAQPAPKAKAVAAKKPLSKPRILDDVEKKMHSVF